MAESLALVWDLIARDNASPTFARVGASAEGASAGVGKLLGGLSALAVGGAIAASVKAAADFQASMLLVQTQAGATAQEVADMSPKILALAGQVAQAPEALATSLYHVESTGLRGAQALDAVRVAAEGAKVGHADLEQTTNALTATIASGMLPATETFSQAMGQLNTIVGSGDMKMQDLNDALGSGLLVVTKQYGVGINDVGAALATFGDNNIRGADAATMLRMAVQAIQNPGKKAAAALGEIGLTVEQLRSDEQTGGLNKALTDLHTHLVNSGIDASQWGQILTDAFTKKAGSGLITLVGQFDRFQQKYEEVSKGADKFGDAWANTTKTANFQFGQLKDTIDAAGIALGEKLLPPISAFMGWLNSTAIPAVERFGGSLSQAVQSPQFQSFLRDVETLGAGAWQAIQNVSGVLIDLGKTVLPPVVQVGGELLHLFSELPGPVQLAAGAFVALRIAAAKGMFDGLLSAASGVGGAFRGFGADVSATTGVLSAAGVPLAGFAATLQTTAERGMGALRSGAQGVVNMLGGPFMTGLALAGGAVAGWAATLQATDTISQDVTQHLKDGSDNLGRAYQDLAVNQGRSIADAHSWGDAMDIAGAAFQDGAAQLKGYSSAADEAKSKGTEAYNNWYASLGRLGQAQEDVTKATKDYNDAASQYGPNSAQAKDAADRLSQANQWLNTTQRDVNQATQTHLDLLKQESDSKLASVNSGLAVLEQTGELNKSIADYNEHIKQGSKYTGDLTVDSGRLADQTITLAKTTAQHAADQAKVNGVTDTSIAYNNTLHDSLVKMAGELSGDAQKAVLDAAKATEGASIKTDSFRDSVDKLGLHVGQVWPDGTKVVQGATKQQIDALNALGYRVTTLPGSDPKKPQTIFVSADTNPAYAQLNDFEKRVAALGFEGAIWNLGAPIGQGPSTAPTKTQIGGNPIGFPPVPGLNKADGGLILGPGTGTSDSIPAMLSNGEFVVNAKATSQHHELLHAINSGAVGKYAQGGLVWPAVISATVMNGLNAQLQGKQAAAAASAVGGVPASRAANEAAVNHAASYYGWNSGVQWNDLIAVIMRESGFNNVAQNPTSSAYGMFQFLDSTWRNYGGSKTSDPAEQARMGMTYMFDRYGSPAGALAHENAFGWYKNGTNYVPNDGPAYLHKGEAVIPAGKNQGAPYQAGTTTVRVFIGDRELTDIVRTEVDHGFGSAADSLHYAGG